MSGGHSLGQLGIRSYRESQLVRKTIFMHIVSGTVSGMSLIDERIHERIVAKKARLDNLRPFPEDAVRKLRQAYCSCFFKASFSAGNISYRLSTTP